MKSGITLTSRAVCFAGLFLILTSSCWLENYSASAQEAEKLSPENLSFLATFDSTLRADKGKGEYQFASDVSRQKFLSIKELPAVSIQPGGKFGSAVRFSEKTKEVLCYPALGNFPYSEKTFNASISFWMKCDPAKLPKGFIDPLQITDKKWNDASIFVDFNDKRPADFRLGVFSDLSFWNPDNKDFNKMDPEERPMVDAGKVPFAADRWVHIGLVFKGMNHSEGLSECTLYVDGKRIGTLKRKQKFSWNLEKTYLMLGIYYVGFLDDFAVFNVALTEKQIQMLATSGKSVSDLVGQK